MQIKWEKKAKGIYIGIGEIELKNTMPRKVALRLDGRGKMWRVDLATGTSSPWQAIDGGAGVRTLAEAKKLAQTWLSSADTQGTLTPYGAQRNPPVCYIPPIPPVPARKRMRRNPPESRVMSIPRPRVRSWDSERVAMLPPPPPRVAPDLPIPPLKLPPLDPGLSVVRSKSRRGASLAGTRKSGIKPRPSVASRASSIFTANDLAPVSKSFVKLRDTAAKKFKDVGMTRLEANASIHDSPRAFAITEIRKDGPVITVAPELAKQPKEIIDGVIAHELGHVAVMLGHFPMKSKHDDMQRQADFVAESIFGKKIYYKGNLKVQSMGKGAKGARPRPAALR